MSFLYASGLVNNSICASVWLVKLDDITKLGCPVAQPRLTSRPLARTMICLPSSNSTRSTCGLISVHLRSEEHTSELQSLMRISYAVFCLKKKNIHNAKP